MKTKYILCPILLLCSACPSKPDVSSDAGPSPSASSVIVSPPPSASTSSSARPPIVHEPGTVHSAVVVIPHDPPPPAEPTFERFPTPAQVRKTPGALSGVSYLGDGSSVAFLFDKGALVVDLPTGTGYLMTTHVGIASMELSDDKSLLAVRDTSDRLLLWEMPAGKLRRTWKGIVSPVAFSRDAKRIAAADKAIAVWDTATGAESFRSEPTEGSVGALVFGKADKELVVMVNWYEVMVYDLERNVKIGGGTAETGATFAITLSPDGRWAAASSPAGHGLEVFDVHDWKPRKLVESASCQEHIFPSFDASSTHVFAQGGDRFVKGFVTGSFAPWASFHAVGGSALASAAADLSRVVITRGGKDPAVVTVETKTEKKLDKPFGQDVGYSISPDGRFVSAIENEKVAQVWDAKTGRVIFALAP